MTEKNHYPIGTPNKAWGDAEKQEWLSQQGVKRSYHDEVIMKVEALKTDFEVIQYGALPYDEERYPLFAVKSQNWDETKQTLLVTGGVHGYETSGVQGALLLLKTRAKDYCRDFNVLVAPCLSPWGYESINRWNPMTVDPNRSFFEGSGSPEATQFMKLLEDLSPDILCHIDLHETTDTDNSEFRPALAARDGVVDKYSEIPDGFYVVGDTNRPAPGFQKAIIDSVREVTHIALPDSEGNIIGAPLEQDGVINYDKIKLKLCGGVTQASYVSTTEVYPDSPKSNDEICCLAQVAAIVGGFDYVLSEMNKG
ncbi:DUF2817 domain-containing protein [Alteromonadaceae bacterium M269]|nr:DUF2817 domain-containing protein [Alteromonadaceae bacterium M269]